MIEAKVSKNNAWEKVGSKRVIEGTQIATSIAAGNSGDVYKIDNPEPGIYLVFGQLRVPFSASHGSIFPQIQIRTGNVTAAYETPHVPNGSDTIIMNISTVLTNPSDIRLGAYASVKFENLSGHLKAVRV